MKWLELWAKIEVWGYIITGIILGSILLFWIIIIIYVKVEEKIKKAKRKE